MADRIALCAIVKNEAAFLAEWLAYHAVIGVGRFVLFDNGSTDETCAVIDRAARHLPIERIDWPSPSAGTPLPFAATYRLVADAPAHPVEDWRAMIALSPQVAAYNHALQRFGGQADWMLFLDADEFFVPLADPTLGDFLAFFADPGIGAVCLNVKYFGSAGLPAPDGRPVIERFTRCAEPSFDGHAHVKSIVRPAAMDRMLIHAGRLRHGHAVDEFGRPVVLQHLGIADRISMHRAQINHYSVKSRAEFAAKRARGHPHLADDHPEKFLAFEEDYFQRQDRNEDSDTAILRFLPAVRDLMAKLV